MFHGKNGEVWVLEFVAEGDASPPAAVRIRKLLKNAAWHRLRCLSVGQRSQATQSSGQAFDGSPQEVDR